MTTVAECNYMAVAVSVTYTYVLLLTDSLELMRLFLMYMLHFDLYL